MKKRFVAKKRGKGRILKICLLVFIIYISFIMTFNLLLRSKIDEYFSNSNLADTLFKMGTVTDEFATLELLNPKDMLKMSLNYALSVTPKESESSLELLKGHVNDAEPIVYIYNTHDTETYDSSLLESYNIKYSVKIASYILSDYLKDLGITSYVEKQSMSDYLSTNGLLYKDSYAASRYYIEKRLAEYDTISLIVDVHRDSVSASATRAEIDGDYYAKVLFVVGLDYDGYEKNLALAEHLNSKLDPKLSRGISKKSGSSVNGIYNQNLTDRALLLEVGGVDNTIEEVDNTLRVVAKILFDYLSEE